MELTKYPDITPRTDVYAAKRMLKRGQHLTVTERYGQSRPLPKKHSQTMKFRRYESLVNATAPLAEGVTPAGQMLRYSDITVVLQQFGSVVPISDVVLDTHEDDTMKETHDLCGEQIAETVEILRIAVLKAGSNVFYSNNVASRTAVASGPTRGDVRRIVRSFKRRKAKLISKIIKASHLISTEPVAPAYFSLSHSDLDPDIRGMTDFRPVEEYSNSDGALPGELGKCEGVRFLTTALFEAWAQAATSVSTTNFLSQGEIPSSAANPDVYPMIFLAQDAYALVPLQGMNAVTPYTVYPKAQVGDELAQKGFVAWKMWQASVILNQNWCARLETLATAKPD